MVYRWEVTFSFLLLWSVVNIRSVTDAGDVESARCSVRCLAHLKHKLGGAGDSTVTFSKCFQDPECTACLKPCTQPFMSIAQCIQLCAEDESDCEQSCRFLKHLRAVRPGVCPRPEEATGFEAACIDTCKNDADCEEQISYKCCSNGCGLTCQLPQQLHIGVPQTPQTPDLRERSKSGAIMLSWRAVESNNSIPILYMVQSRYNVGIHHSEHHMTDWEQVTQTTETNVVVREVGPGKWYEFRVAAVGINGTRGFSIPTKAFKLSREPQPPGPPTNLTEGDTRIQDGKIHVTVHWEAPKKADLPVVRYKIYWSKRLKAVTAQLISLREHKKVVPGSELSYELEDLDADTTYFVQVQAISAYGDLRLKSERTATYITTYAFPQATEHIVPTLAAAAKPIPTLPELKNITIHDPYFLNGLLKSNITWEAPKDYGSNKKVLLHWLPEVCIADNTGVSPMSKYMSASTHEVYFIIYDLRFDCRYLIRVQLVSEAGEVGPITHLSFATPSCSEVPVHGDIEPDCPTNIPRVPEDPVGLQHSFLITQLNITSKISWSHPLSDAAIMGYRIVWGQTIPGSGENHNNAALDQNTALTKVLPKDVTTFAIGNLQEATSYLVRLQALSRIGSGKVASISFRTPVLQPQPIVPPYRTTDDNSYDDRDVIVGPETTSTRNGRTASTYPSMNIEDALQSSGQASLYYNLYLVITLASSLLIVGLNCR